MPPVVRSLPTPEAHELLAFGMIALLVLPLYIPVLIFGVSAVEGEVMGLSGRPPPR